MIEVDGSGGEGGGQLLRTALSLAAISGRHLRLLRIRAGRRTPGLAPQHLTVVRALAEICQAELEGDWLGSTQVDFAPGDRIMAGKYTFDISQAAPNGSAGSVTLLAQALLPVLALADGPSELILHGGTHVPWSPSFHYFKAVYLPLWRQLGIKVRAELERWGFYPAGGGRIHLAIQPTRKGLKRGIELTARGDLQSIEGVAVAANLPAHIAQRMTDRAHSLLVDITPAFKLQARRVRSAGPGAGIFATAVYQHSTAGFSNLGELGKPAEEVAEEACSALLQHHQSGAAIDHYLADQCLLPLAMADGNSKFITSHLTSHFHSSAQLIRQLLPQAQISHASSQTGVAVQVVGVGLHPA